MELKIRAKIISFSLSKHKQSFINYTWKIFDGHKAISHGNSSVGSCGTPVHDFSDVDAVIPRNVLVSNTAGNREPEALRSLEQFYLRELVLVG